MCKHVDEDEVADDREDDDVARDGATVADELVLEPRVVDDRRATWGMCVCPGTGNIPELTGSGPTDIMISGTGFPVLTLPAPSRSHVPSHQASFSDSTLCTCELDSETLYLIFFFGPFVLGVPLWI